MSDFYTYRNEVAGKKRKRSLMLALLIVLAAACEGDGIKVGGRYGAQHGDSYHAVVGVEVFGIDGLLDGRGGIPHGGIDGLHDAGRAISCTDRLSGSGRFNGGFGLGLGAF